MGRVGRVGRVGSVDGCEGRDGKGWEPMGRVGWVRAEWEGGWATSAAGEGEALGQQYSR